MKKTIALLTVLLIVCLLACLTSCGECEHEFGEWQVTTAPTCGAPGEKTQVCAKCGETRTSQMAMLPEHTYGEWAVTTPATCKDAGVETRTCSVCHGEETRPVEKLTTHTYGEWVETTPATCKDAGVETHTCSVCQKTETQPIAKLTTHTYGEWVETTPASCKAAGVETHTCSVCQKTETQPIAQLAHSYGEAVVVPATFFTDGSSTKTCSVCQHVETETLARTGSNVYLYEDYSKTVVDVTNTTSVLGGISYGLNKKENVSAKTVTEDGETFLEYKLGANSTDPSLNIQTDSTLGLSGKTLKNILVDGKFTFSVDMKKDADHNAANIKFRLRGKDGTGDVIIALGVTGAGAVYMGTTTNVVGQLTTEFKRFTVTVDFTNALITYYENGEQKATYALAFPSASEFKDDANWDRWTANTKYVLNGNSGKNTTDVDTFTYFDNFILIGGGMIDDLKPVQPAPAE